MWRLDEGIRWQKAPRQFAGTRARLLDRRQRTSASSSSRPAITWRRSTRRPACPIPKFGKNGVVDLMDGLGLPLVPLAVDDSGSLDHQRRRAGSEGEAGREVGSGDEDRRRRHRSASIPRYGQIANSSPAIIVGDVIVVGNSSIHGYYPIRMHNIPGFIRGFDVRTGKQLWKFNLVPQPGEFGAETWKNGSKIGTEGVGKNDAWATYSADPGARARLHPGRHAAAWTNTAAIVRATTCSATASSRST